MKSWRKIVIFTLLLAMPISLWASVAMSSHCLMPETSSHSSHTQMDDNGPDHSDGYEASQDVSDQSNCECEDNLNCSVTGCGALALLNKTAIDFTYLIDSVYQKTQSFANPIEPDLLFRPPITNS